MRLVKKALVIAGILLFSFSLFATNKMPEFSLPDLSGKTVKLSSLLATGPVLIDFWASWCQPCLKSLSHYEAIHQKYPNLHVIAINTDTPKSLSRGKAEIKSKGYTFNVLLDSNRDIQKKLNIDSIPHSFLVNQQGEIVFDHTGYTPGDEVQIEKAVRELLQLSIEEGK